MNGGIGGFALFPVAEGSGVLTCTTDGPFVVKYIWS